MRKRYRLPYALNASPLDISVALSSSDSAIQTKRQLTVRVILIVVAGVMLYMGLVTQTILGRGGVFGITTWTIGYFWLLYLICIPTLTKQVGLNEVVPMIRYAMGTNRHIGTRSSNLAKPIRDLVGVDGVEPETGKILYSNGEVGVIYEAVGNASILMFDEDKEHVLQSTRNFYRKLSPNISMLIDFSSEPQKIYKQVESAKQRQANLQIDSPGLRQLLHSDIEFMREVIGREFKSLHQYIVVRAKNDEALFEFDSWLLAQVEKDGAFVTDYLPLEADDVEHYFKGVFSEVPKPLDDADA